MNFQVRVLCSGEADAVSGLPLQVGHLLSAQLWGLLDGVRTATGNADNTSGARESVHAVSNPHKPQSLCAFHRQGH